MEAKAFAYLRVSGLGQNDGDGFPRQLAAIKKYAATNGVKLVKVFRETKTGKSDLDSREALQELIAELSDAGVTMVLIEGLNRLARSLMIQESILADLRKRGIQLVSTMEPDLDSDDPSRVAFRQMMGIFSQYERAMIVLKLRGARDRMRATQGRCEGRKAYGARPGETQTIERIRALRDAGTPVAHIAAQLNAEGIAPRAGAMWHATQVSRILTRASI